MPGAQCLGEPIIKLLQRFASGHRHRGRCFPNFFRQILGQNGIARGGHGAAINDVLQLTHIAGPSVAAEQLQRLGRDFARLHLFGLGQILHKEVDDLRHILAALPQRRELHAYDIEPVIKVFAEFLRAHQIFEILVGGGDHADVDLDRLHPAHALDFAFLQHAQDFGLRGGCHIADFIEKNRAAIAQFKFTQPLRRGTGERAAFVAEEFTFDQIFRDRRAIHRHEGLGRTMTVAMETAGDEFLARATLARDHHRGIAGGKLADDLEDLLHGGRGADNAFLVLIGVDDRFVAGG